MSVNMGLVFENVWVEEEYDRWFVSWSSENILYIGYFRREVVRLWFYIDRLLGDFG